MTVVHYLLETFLDVHLKVLFDERCYTHRLQLHWRFLRNLGHSLLSLCCRFLPLSHVLRLLILLFFILAFLHRLNYYNQTPSNSKYSWSKLAVRDGFGYNNLNARIRASGGIRNGGQYPFFPSQKENSQGLFGRSGLMMAVLLHHYNHKLVNLHNYPPANSLAKKIENWNTLSTKVLKRLGIQLTKAHIEHIANATPGVIEELLYNILTKF